MHGSKRVLATTQSIHMCYTVRLQVHTKNVTLLYSSRAIRPYKGEVSICLENLRSF